MALNLIPPTSGETRQSVSVLAMPNPRQARLIGVTQPGSGSSLCPFSLTIRIYFTLGFPGLQVQTTIYSLGVTPGTKHFIV